MGQGTRPSFASVLALEHPIAVEIGVLKGENALEMLKAKWDLKLYLVDKLEQPNLGVDLEPFHLRAEFIEKSSVEAASLFCNQTFDYIYIDADHSELSVSEDLNAWYPKLKPGGRFAGHDWARDGVSFAVKKFAKENDLRICTEGLDWWFK